VIPFCVVLDLHLPDSSFKGDRRSILRHTRQTVAIILVEGTSLEIVLIKK